MDIVRPYIIWNFETGEIYSFGKGVYTKVRCASDQRVYWGDPLDAELYVFDPETGQPVLREQARLATDLDKQEAMNHIDREAGSIRSQYITTTPGQELVYQQKEAEANLLSTNPDVHPSEIPHLVAEADILGVTPMEVAITVQMMAAQWRNLSAVIECKRLAAKAAVMAATNMDEVRSATEVDWNGS